MPSLNASTSGVLTIKQARKEKGWTIDNPLWLEAASRILEPERDWEHGDVFASGVSLATWKRFLQGKNIDSNIFKVFCQILEINWENVVDRSLAKNPPVEIFTNSITHLQIPRIPLFFGRGLELEALIEKLIYGNYLVAITGMGGIGKTALAVKLVEVLLSKFTDRFAQVFWFSLQFNFPPANTPNYFPSFPPQSLVIFDGWDVMLGGERGGQYTTGYEFYQGYLRSLLQLNNSSCFILTSREQPQGLNLGMGTTIFPLGGLNEGAVELLQHHELIFDAEQWIVLVKNYGGNPLFLNMAANLIKELFAGNVGEFLASGTIIAGEFKPLVEQWLVNISSLEKNLLQTLATFPQGLTLNEVRSQLAENAATGDIFAAIVSLKRRALVETSKQNDGERFFLQPVILKCVQRYLIGC